MPLATTTTNTSTWTGCHDPEPPLRTSLIPNAPSYLPSTTTPEDMQMGGPQNTPSPLLGLPPELLILLTTHLPPASQVALKLTSRALFTCISPAFKANTLDACARSQILCHVAEAREMRAAASNGRLHCALCKTLYPTPLFAKATCLDPGIVGYPLERGPEGELGGGGGVGVGERCHRGGVSGEGDGLPRTSPLPLPVPLPVRICKWHIPRFVHDLRSAAFKARFGVRSYWHGPGEWAASVERACMHCGCVVVLGGGGGGEGDCFAYGSRTGFVHVGRVPGRTCECDCQSCGVRDVRVWWRVEPVGFERSPVVAMVDSGGERSTLDSFSDGLAKAMGSGGGVRGLVSGVMGSWSCTWSNVGGP